MKLTVIGCWGGYPRVNEASAGYLLEKDGFHLLLDCGSGVLSLLPNYLPVKQLDAVILTHYHADHIADIGVLQHALLIQSYLTEVKTPLPIYGHPFAEEAFKQLTYKDITTGIGYDPTKPLEIGPFTIHFLETNHSVPCFALRIEADGKSLVYTGDSAYTDAFIDFVRDADLLLSECNFYDGMDGSTAGHMNSKDAATIAAKGNVKQLVLTHLPHFGDVEKLPQEAKKYFSGPVHLAKKGQVWNI